MRKTLHVLGLVSAMLLAACGTQAEPTEATFSDEKGDLGLPENDLLEVRVRGADDHLIISGKVAKNPVKSREANMGDGMQTMYRVASGDIASLYIDSDGDVSTGEAPYRWEGEAGFDHAVDLSFCYEVPDTPGCDGGQNGATGAKIRVRVSALVDDAGSDHEMDAGTLDSADFTAKLPYEALGVEAGDTIRIYVDETGNIFSGVDESRVQSVTLG